MINSLMFKTLSLRTFICISLIITSCLGWIIETQDIAQAESRPPTDANGPDADPKLEELTFFTKQWTCTGEDSDKNAIAPFQWSMIRELNDLWFFAQAKRQPTGIFQVETFGYNTIIGKLGRTIIGNDGTFGNFLSDGWQENQLIWRGSSSNMLEKTTGKHQIVVTRTSDRSFTEVERMASGDDQWTMISTQECVLPETR